MTARPRLWLLAMLAVLPLALGSARGEPREDPARPAPVFNVDGRVALASLMALADGHLVKLAESMRLLAATPETRSADWAKLREPLAQLGASNVAALNWFALPDGSYWSVQEGKAAGNLARRAYFPRVLAGQTVIGELVASTATGRSVAIVAVPVTREDGRAAGVLGASVYLDRLSAQLEREMDLDDSLIFFSFDARPLVGLDWDPGLIFTDPTRLGDAALARAFRDMLARDAGVASYVFRGKRRTVLFRRSPVTGWWYAFGRVPDGRDAEQPARVEHPSASP